MLLPWQQMWNGRTWQDMPGNDIYEQRVNFALFRRGLIHVEEERVSGPDGEEEVKVFMVSNYNRRLKSRKRFRRRVLKARPDLVTSTEILDASRLMKEQARTRAKMWFEKQRGAIRQIAALAGVNYDNLLKFIRNGMCLGMERVGKVAAVLDKLDRGELTLHRGWMRTPRPPTVVPPGAVPFKQWLREQAARTGVKWQAVYMRLKRHPQEMPEIIKVHGRAWFVKVGEGERSAA